MCCEAPPYADFLALGGRSPGEAPLMRANREQQISSSRLAKSLRMWHRMRMNATLSLDEAGRLALPNTALRALGMKPG